MIVATQGLVLHTTKYSESSVIAKIFTRQLGVRSYILKGVRSSRSRTKQNLLQPLSHVDLAVYDSPHTTINYIKDIHPATQYPNTATDSARMALVFFMNEVLYKVLHDDDPQAAIFDLVVEQLEWIDSDRVRFAMQPIVFLLKLSQLMGVEPLNNYTLRESLFSLKEGHFVAPPTTFGIEDTTLLTATASLRMHYLLASLHGEQEPVGLDCRATLRDLIDYYAIHLPDCRDLKSVEVLHALV